MVSSMLLCVPLLGAFTFVALATADQARNGTDHYPNVPAQSAPYPYAPPYPIPQYGSPQVPMMPYGYPGGNMNGPFPSEYPPNPHIPSMAYPPQPMPVQTSYHSVQYAGFGMGPFPPHFHRPYPMPPSPVDHFYCSAHATFALTLANARKVPPPYPHPMPPPPPQMPGVAASPGEDSPNVGVQMQHPYPPNLIETRQLCRYIATTTSDACQKCCQVAARHYPLAQAEVIGLLLAFNPKKPPVPPVNVGPTYRRKKRADSDKGMEHPPPAFDKEVRPSCLCCAPKELFGIY